MFSSSLKKIKSFFTTDYATQSSNPWMFNLKLSVVFSINNKLFWSLEWEMVKFGFTRYKIMNVIKRLVRLKMSNKVNLK
jgi:hypothetical protein